MHLLREHSAEDAEINQTFGPNLDRDDDVDVAEGYGEASSRAME